MHWRRPRCLSLGLVLASCLSAAQSGLRITVFVYNYATAPSHVLAQAEAAAARIYQHSGIEIAWLDCPLSPEQAAQYPACQIAPSPTRLAVRILSRTMAERYHQAEDTFGFAQYPGNGSFGMVANVFSNEAEELATHQNLAHGVLLGHLMAHELGHLLLGVGSRSASGIMHVPWYRKELEIISQGLMLFEPWEAARMRTQIRARMASELAAHPSVH